MMNIVAAFVLGCSLLAPGDSVAGFVSIDHDPGTEVWCLMSLERQIHVSCVEACPNFCQSNLLSSDIVAKYNKVSRLCECYTAFGVCEQSSPKNAVEFVFVAEDLWKNRELNNCLNRTCQKYCESVHPHQLSQYNADQCNECSENDNGELKVRECIWFDATRDGSCEEKRSTRDSSYCENATLTLPCPANDNYRPWNFYETGECCFCGNNSVNQVVTRQCVWFESDGSGGCSETRSEVNFTRCAPDDATKPCSTLIAEQPCVLSKMIVKTRTSIYSGTNDPVKFVAISDEGTWCDLGTKSVSGTVFKRGRKDVFTDEISCSVCLKVKNRSFASINVTILGQDGYGGDWVILTVNGVETEYTNPNSIIVDNNETHNYPRKV